MGERGRYACVIGVAMLAAVAVAVLGASDARSQPVSVIASSPPAVVDPFFILPTARPATSPALLGFSAESVIRREQWTVACSGCRKTRFLARRGIHRVKFRASPALHMRSATRILIGIVATGEIGRWIAFGFKDRHYVGLGHGCMPTSVKVLSRAEAGGRAKIPSIDCGPPSPPGTEYVLWTGADHQIYEKQFVPNAVKRSCCWHDAYPIGSGTGVMSAPAVLIRGKGERDVFWEGFDHHIHWMSFTDDWADEIPLPAGSVRSGPSATVDVKGNAHVFWEGTTRYVYGLSDLGTVPRVNVFNSGYVGSPPAVAPRADGTLDLFWWGTDKLLWELPQASANATADCISGAGTLGSAPSAVFDTHQHEDIFWRGTDGLLWELSRPTDPRSRGSLVGLTGRLGSAPSVVVHPSGVQDVFWEGTHHGLREMVGSATAGWSDTKVIHSDFKVASRPAVVLSPAGQPGVRQTQSATVSSWADDFRDTVRRSCPQ